MVKKKILIASVLKPVNEPRMYKKLGLSLAQNPDLDLHIAGYSPSQSTEDKDITFHPIFNFKRLSFKRIHAKKVFSKLLHQIGPDVLIVNTFELLGPAIQYKRLNKCRVIYDIRENHRFNILHLGVYPWPLKYIPARIVAIAENRFAPEVDHFLLAEACYAEELSFLDGRYTVIENKYAGPLIERQSQSGQLRLAFTGTLHNSTGVFEAIRLFEALKDDIPGLQLSITGHAAPRSVFEAIKQKAQPGLILRISNTPLGNSEILDTYRQSDILLAPYRMSVQNQNKIPTKLYDALANGIPMIISRNPKWQDLTGHLPWIYHHNFADDMLEDVSAFIREKHDTQPQRDAMWESEREKLLALPYF